MPAPSKAFTVINDGAVDSDSPIDQALMTAYRDNLIHLEEWLGNSFTAAQDHDHDGVNSKSVVGVADGTITEVKLASAAVSQAKLKTTVGQGLHITGEFALPAGEYGFFPQIGSNTAADAIGAFDTQSLGEWGSTGGGNQLTGMFAQGGTSFGGRVFLTQIGNSCNGAHVQQRFVAACPPYDYGHGEAGLFVFIKLDRNGNQHGVAISMDPPWALHGPTWIVPDYYRMVKGVLTGFQKRLVVPDDKSRLLAGDLAWEEVKVTQALKNADMDLVPHPFAHEDGITIALLDPCCELAHRLAAMHDVVTSENGQAGADPHSFDYSPVGYLLHEGYIQIDAAPLPMRTPKGVITVAPKWKRTRRK